MNRDGLALLADFLRENQPAIIEEWVEKVRKENAIEGSEEMSFQELADHLPTVFERLIHSIRTANPKAFRAEVQNDAAKHGVHRWKQNLKVGELVKEIGYIRRLAVRRVIDFLRLNPSLMDVVYFGMEMMAQHFDRLAVVSISQFVELQQQSEARLTADLKALNEQLRVQDEKRLRALRHITHEVRNHMNAIHMVSSVLGMDADIVRREHLAMLGRDVTAVTNFMKELEEYATVSEPSSQSIRLERFLSTELFDDIVLFCHELARRKGLKFTISCDPEIGIVTSDRRKLHSIVMNLATNAIKYTEAGEVSLAFGKGELAETWSISVRDTGPGISPEDQPYIFDEFFRCQATVALPGSGLGLAITRELVRALQGEIELESEPRRGTRFTVTMPQHFSSENPEAQSLA